MVADTNRFNRDTRCAGGQEPSESQARTRSDVCGLTSFGIPIEWEEQPFEWVRPQRFGVVRRYSKGPMEELRVLAESGAAKRRHEISL